jgi:hypothetical protein
MCATMDAMKATLTDDKHELFRTLALAGMTDRELAAEFKLPSERTAANWRAKLAPEACLQVQKEGSPA